MGLLNYGAFYENVQKGLYGSVMINNYNITEGRWSHQKGLKGEHNRVSNIYKVFSISIIPVGTLGSRW